jgi:hypothetical protein
MPSRLQSPKEGRPEIAGGRGRGGWGKPLPYVVHVRRRYPKLEQPGEAVSPRGLVPTYSV